MAARCIIKVREMESPISGTPRGLRVLVALPNMASRTFAGEPCPSFDKPWAITWFGDFTDQGDVLASMRGIGKTLRRMGFDRFEIV